LIRFLHLDCLNSSNEKVPDHLAIENEAEKLFLQATMKLRITQEERNRLLKQTISISRMAPESSRYE